MRYKILKEYPNYKIYEDGSVYSLYSKRFLSQYVGKNGYIKYGISNKNKKWCHLSGHVLVAKAFLGKRPEGNHVCHGDNNKTNNHYTNLRYDTPKGNGLDCAKAGIRKGIKNSQAKLNDLKVKLIRSLYSMKNKNNKMSQRLLAREFGVDQNIICSVVNRERWGHVK